MNITKLTLTNMRAIATAVFAFQPGFNLIVGVNGVGKTSVLDALAVCLSAVTKQVNHLRGSVESFVTDDIRVGCEAMTTEIGVALGGDEYTYLIHKPRSSSAPQKKGTGEPRGQVHATPERAEYIGRTPKPFNKNTREGRPLAVLFPRAALCRQIDCRRRAPPQVVSMRPMRKLLPTGNCGWANLQLGCGYSKC